MAGMQFEYDEKGGTFYYFLISFLALILVPTTYYLWPRKSAKEDEEEKYTCHCEPCQMKKQLLRSSEPWVKTKRNSIKLLLIVGWIFFAFVAYKTSQVELDFSDFDPYGELGVDRGANNAEIKKAYHKLSLKFHPDKKDGDPQRFMRITKAYQALTDEEAKKNWEQYGNPDGPGATHFGIALPKWIVEKQNSVWVLAVYVLVFMVLLPTVVGMWWYRSIKYSAEQVLMDTTQLYYYFFHKTPNMNLQRVIMILGASMEFNKLQNSEIVERPSDNEEMPALMRELPNLNEKNKEKPLCFPFSIKARALILANCARLELPPKTLELDRQYIIKKCPYLINEMVTIVAQLVALAHAGRAQHKPRLETIENCMKVSQMVVQALQQTAKSPFLQLPHIREDMLRHFNTKRRNIRTIGQFVQMKEDERRQLLRSLNESEYQDVINVCYGLPHVTMDVHIEVLDDEDPTVTAGSIVTVTVRLKRENMEVLFEKEQELAEEEMEEEQNEEEETTPTPQTTDSPVRKPKVWEKQQKKKKGGKGGKKAGKKAAKPAIKSKPITNVGPGAPAAVSASKDGSDSPEPNGTIVKKRAKQPRDEDQSTEDESERDTENEGDLSEDEEGAIHEDDEDDWKKFQEEAKKDNVLETKSKETHIVHCPYFPAAKYEWWWLYVADRKNHLLITAPAQITSLKDTEEVSLKFSAPPKLGYYEYCVVLRSDSYLEFDKYHKFKLDVKEAKKVESHPQWEMSDDEDEDKADGDLTETEDDSFDESDDE